MTERFHELSGETAQEAAALLGRFRTLQMATASASGEPAVGRPKFRWVNTILGNIKSALRGTYHAIRPKYAQRYLSEFEYRFNRRFDLPGITPRLVYVALRTPPMQERLLKLRYRTRQRSHRYFHNYVNRRVVVPILESSSD